MSTKVLVVIIICAIALYIGLFCTVVYLAKKLKKADMRIDELETENKTISFQNSHSKIVRRKFDTRPENNPMWIEVVKFAMKHAENDEQFMRYRRLYEQLH